MPRLRLRFPFGLRARITVGFGLLGLGVSLLLALVVWSIVPTYLLAQRESTALRQSQLNATALERGLAVERPSVPQLLTSLPATEDTASLLSYEGRWYAGSLDTSPDALPGSLRRLVLDGTAARQRVSLRGSPVLVVGLPLRSVDGAYFAIYPLSELDRAYRVVSISLLIGVAVTALVGMATGRLASGRALRPLTDVSHAAAAIARGDFTARLPTHSTDPDLAPIARTFNANAADLQRRVEADARFAGDVSHELRTPLTTMVNSLELLRTRRAALPAEAREAVDLLGEDLDRFGRIVTDLLEISRADSGPHLLAGEQVRIAELVRRSADAAAMRPVTHVSEAAEPVTLQADKRRIERAVTNLVENAERHGHGCRQVLVEATRSTVRIVVDDAGPGVPADRRQRIFERFARAPGAEPGPGAGLGLAIVARHVALHEGTVRVEDSPSGGARFVIELPTGAP